MTNDPLFECIEKKVRALAPEEFTQKSESKFQRRGTDVYRNEIGPFTSHSTSYACQVGPFLVKIEEGYEETGKGPIWKPRYSLLVEEDGEIVKAYRHCRKAEELFKCVEQRVLDYEIGAEGKLRKGEPECGEKRAKRERKLAEVFLSIQ